MMDIESAEDLNDLIVRFRNKATGNDLMTDEQKLEMLAMVEYTHAMHEYLIRKSFPCKVSIKKIAKPITIDERRMSLCTSVEDNEVKSMHLNLWSV